MTATTQDSLTEFEQEAQRLGFAIEAKMPEQRGYPLVMPIATLANNLDELRALEEGGLTEAQGWRLSDIEHEGVTENFAVNIVEHPDGRNVKTLSIWDDALNDVRILPTPERATEVINDRIESSTSFEEKATWRYALEDVLAGMESGFYWTVPSPTV